MTASPRTHGGALASILAAGVVFLFACAPLHESTDTEATAPTTNPEVLEAMAPADEAAFTWVNVWIDGDSLRAIVQYGGGCGSHDFVLEASGPMLKSLPPKQPLRVIHRSDGDPCRALIEESLAWGVRAYRGTPRGITELLLEDWTEPLNYPYP